MSSSSPPSKTQVKKAGSTVRKFGRGEADRDELNRAIAVITAYRSQFSDPIVKVNNGLRYIARKHTVDAKVTQRLKRIPTIVEKLSDREDKLDLSRMHDIGGCRAVVGSISEVRELQDAINTMWASRVQKTIDYIEQPRSSGYRAVHVIVETDGLPVEVQLRSQLMHNWAELVERLSRRFDVNFKQDHGDHLVQRFTRGLSEVYRHEEEGIVVSSDFIAEVNDLIGQVNSMLIADRDSQRGQE